MSKNTYNYAETTEMSTNTCALSDVLKSMQVSGSILINEAYVPPWSVAIPDATSLANLLKLGAGTQAVAFHYVKRGFIEVVPEVGAPVKVTAGEIVICFGGIAHQLTQYPDNKAVPVETILLNGNNPFAPSEHNLADSTAVMCGVFMLQNFTLNPLLSSLPKLLHVANTKLGGDQSVSTNNLSNTLNWIDREISHTTKHAYVIEKLLELLCAEVLRSHLENKATSTGWFQAMQDPIISRAITMMHAQPSDDWSVKKLADAVAISPSRFAARFNAALGDSPMAYLTKWRMNIASRLLDDNDKNVQKIANAVGYENVSAFSRTFKRHIGMPPIAWRANAMKAK